MTAHLTAIGFHDPKSFPKSVKDLLKKSEPKKPFNKNQWEAIARYLSDGAPPLPAGTPGT